jgi:3-methyladenine DNA glycosylase AlkD
MHPERAKLLAELRRAAPPTTPERHTNDSYGGSGRPFYNISAPAQRAIARGWLARNKAMESAAFLAVLESLFAGESHDEKTLAALLVACHKKARRDVRPADLGRWLGQLNGWAEIDSLCQNVFSAEDMLGDWPAWKGFIDGLSKDANINKRRAAMVLLNAPVRYSDDPRFRDLALAVVERLKAERPILITKAVSWLLRSMVTRHRDALSAYLAAQADSLPTIAVRETRTKLETGTKSGRGKKKSAFREPPAS